MYIAVVGATNAVKQLPLTKDQEESLLTTTKTST
jgi:hypothetical protein